MIEILLDAVIPGSVGTGYLISALGTLAAVVGFLARMIFTNHKETKDRCEIVIAKQEETQEKVIELTGKVGKLEGRVHMAEEIGPKIDAVKGLVEEVLESVNQSHESK